MGLTNFASVLSFATGVAAVLDCSTGSFASALGANAKVTSAIRIQNNGTFQVPSTDIPFPTSPTGLQSLCAITVNVVSSNSSAFNFGLFLPDQWNERFLAVGNGGFGGGINWIDMAAGVGYGFVSMSTDTGHSSATGDGTWALNEPEKLNDWGYRAMHGSIVQAKQIVAAYYACDIKYNYYSGCSTGGRQGLREVQLYPDEFDGVLAGSPAWWTSHLQPWTVKVGLYNLPVNSSGHIPASLFPVIEEEILSQCDPQDGVRDSIISDPQGCNVYLDALLCSPSQNASTCLTAPQIETLYNIYTDYIDTNQTFVFPHLELGSEAQWPVLLGGSAPNALGTQYVQDFLLNDPTWDYNDFDYSIVQLADKIQPGNATAYDYDLGPFQAKGGKLLMYHGLADALIATGSSEYFYQKVYRTMYPKGIQVSDFYRFFLVPGMQHCTGTPASQSAPWYFAGANQASILGTSIHSTPGFSDGRHDALLALMEWTEQGTAPNSIIATRFKNDTVSEGVERQRPLCMYPKQAKYLGGDVNQASSWTCD